jgi:hypothetical protein
MLGKALGIELYSTCRALKKKSYCISMDIPFTKSRKLMPNPNICLVLPMGKSHRWGAFFLM